MGPGMPEALVLTEPSTGVPLHLYEGQDRSGVEGYTPLRPTKLGHVASFTPSWRRCRSSTRTCSASGGPTGYWEPRPWHESFPLYPRTWEVDLATVNIWGPINPEMLDH
jgi:hypothetical protein